MYYPNQQVRVDVPFSAAKSANPIDLLAASIESVICDKEFCCGKNSALETAIQSAGFDLPDIARKLQGKHVLSDGRPFTADTEYLSAVSMNSDQLISALMQKCSARIEWNSNL